MSNVWSIRPKLKATNAVASVVDNCGNDVDAKKFASAFDTGDYDTLYVKICFVVKNWVCARVCVCVVCVLGEMPGFKNVKIEILWTWKKFWGVLHEMPGLKDQNIEVFTNVYGMQLRHDTIFAFFFVCVMQFPVI